ncbi:hypothetical protein NRIC_30020 [Enterococcus florum]|uniref:Uncharacterized protein n=1 Tax=Enterococcus florum TaxID=2480627 RepID=A0A4P5PFE9_9ENTE|nr:hypothetical protein [Enterococcus florum]GCF95111.1 hypothetical protein NRIC_30020 [Enterococcus florum]
MATFGKMDTHIDPSEAGKKFPVQTHVTFLVHDKPQTGIVTKQLKNSAIVELDERKDNGSLMTQSNGIVVINYKQLKKIR